ncbi:hypothetical protein CCP3SC15_530008 [Gammaproteobacteria bacterium]
MTATSTPIPCTPENIQAALFTLSPELPHDDWVKIAFAVEDGARTGGFDGFDLFNEWSQGGDSYNAADTWATWKSLRPGKVTVATLWGKAKALGWRPGKESHQESEAERQERERIRQSELAKEQEKLAKARNKAAKNARTLWRENETPAPADNPYLARKGVNPTDTLREIDALKATAILGYSPQSKGELLEGRLLVVPVSNGKELSTVELIDGAGRKHAIKDGAKSGCFWSTQRLPAGAEIIFIGEGVATALSANEAIKAPAVATLSCGNMPAVAKTMRERHPAATLVVLADVGKGQPKAEEATKAVGGVLVVPKFSTEDVEAFTAAHGKAPSDFNDLAVLKGLEAVRVQIEAAVNSRGDKNHQTSYSQLQELTDDELADMQTAGEWTEEEMQESMTDKSRGDKNHQTSYSRVKTNDKDGKKKSQSTILIELAAHWYVFHDADNVGYIVLVRDSIREVWPIRSTAFRQWLSSAFYDLTGKGCNSNAVSDALNTIEARANKAMKSEVYLRVARTGGNLYLDLCDNRWRVIEISSQGWRILDKSPVYFVRKNGMLPLPIPEEGGDIWDLHLFLNIGADDFPLAVGWILGALRGEGDYAVLVLQGEQGTGKSTVSKLVRTFVDPSTVPLRSPPREVRDLLVSAINNHLVVLDNLSGLPPEVSDCLCRLSTGGGHDARALFTDTDQVLVDIQRPVLVNGIDDIATRPDLSERSIVLKLPVIDSANRKDKRTFWADFEMGKTKIMGALLNALSCALRREASVHMPQKPRMADFAIWVTAAEPALGWTPGSFMRVYDKNQHEAIEIGVESSPVGATLLELLEIRGGSWTGKPTDLLTDLTNKAGPLAKSKAWPQSTKGLKNILHRLAPSLRKMGVMVEEHRRMAARLYTVTHCPAQPSYPSYPAGSISGAGFGMTDSMTDSVSMTDSDLPRNPTVIDNNLLVKENVGYDAYDGYPAHSPLVGGVDEEVL